MKTSKPVKPEPQRVLAVFEALSDLPPEEAARKLADECGGDDALQDAVKRLLLHDRATVPDRLAGPRGSALLAEAIHDWDPEQTVTGLVTADEESLAGSSRLGHYYVLHKLAEGGMGLVYLGYDDSLHRRVALKVLRRGKTVSEWLLREGQALGRLSHPNVVSVHEVGEHEGRAFLAMEFIEGPTLRAWLDAGPRSFADVLPVFLQAGRGLSAAHRAGLVHRDFKPENVLLGQDGRARVADFGIVALAEGVQAEAKAIWPTPANALCSPLTQTGVLMGTPAYMSPEQFRRERPTPLSDQYGFCVALYRAAYGMPPHPIEELRDLAHSVLNAPPAQPPRLPEVPAWLAPILLRGLAREPAQRFPSMDDLLAAIESHLPRDPELYDMPLLRERRIIVLACSTSFVLASAPMVSSVGARLLMSPTGLIALPLFLLFCNLLIIAWRWRGLSRNLYGRRLAGLFPLTLVATLAHRLIALRLGLAAEQILVEDMVLLATILGLLAHTFDRWMVGLAMFVAIPASLAAFLPHRAPLLFALLGLACAAALVIRRLLNRHLHPAAIVRPYENAQDVVGFSRVSADS